MNQLPFFLRRIMYRLKRDYGSPISIYHECSDTVDLETGIRTVKSRSWSLERAVCLPTSIHRNSIFSAALKPEFQYGQTVQLGDKTLLIDRTDLPQNLRLGTENWYIIIDYKRYEISRIDEYEGNTAYFVVLKELKGAAPNRTVEILVSEWVHTNSSTSANYPLIVPITIIDTICPRGYIDESGLDEMDHFVNK